MKSGFSVLTFYGIENLWQGWYNLMYSGLTVYNFLNYFLKTRAYTYVILLCLHSEFVNKKQLIVVNPPSPTSTSIAKKTDINKVVTFEECQKRWNKFAKIYVIKWLFMTANRYVKYDIIYYTAYRMTFSEQQ